MVTREGVFEARKKGLEDSFQARCDRKMKRITEKWETKMDGWKQDFARRRGKLRTTRPQL